MRGDTAKFPVCFAEGIARDVASVRRCVAEGLIDVGYALLLDEGGYWRTRQIPPQGECRLWGSDTRGEGRQQCLSRESLPKAFSDCDGIRVPDGRRTMRRARQAGAW